MEMEAIQPGARGGAEGELITVLRPDASADPERDPKLGRERSVELYEAMLRTRVAGERLGALSESGRIGFFPFAPGTEAAVVGATFALREPDWIFPTQGDFGAALARGLSLDALARRAFGGADDPLKGHVLPGGMASRSLRIGSASAPAATHLPHAVGVAWSAQKSGEDSASAAFFDACEIDAADFHTGLNFAGVMRAPVLFLCRTRAGEASAAEHAIAYGLSSMRVDGSDALAVVRAVGDALDRALEGEGATVIDLVIGEPDEAMDRARAHLVRIGAWSDDRERAAKKSVEDELARAIDAASRAGAPAPDTIFEDVFARPAPELERQRSALTRGPRPAR